jgi:hypothetical protein
MLSDGLTYREIADRADCSQPFISKWKQRFLAEGIAGLYSRHEGRTATVSRAVHGVARSSARGEGGGCARPVPEPAAARACALRRRKGDDGIEHDFEGTMSIESSINVPRTLYTTGSRQPGSSPRGVKWRYAEYEKLVEQSPGDRPRRGDRRSPCSQCDERLDLGEAFFEQFRIDIVVP